MAIFRCGKCGAMNRVADARVGDRPVCGGCKAALDASGAPQEVTGEAFDRAVKSAPVPVMVDFWAPWCGPCRTAAPAVAEVGRRNAGRLLVLKVNVDEAQDAAGRYRIQGIPAFVLFEGGREVGRRTGVASRAELEGWIKQATPTAA
jgi:thioredoxin 2